MKWFLCNCVILVNVDVLGQKRNFITDFDNVTFLLSAWHHHTARPTLWRPVQVQLWSLTDLQKWRLCTNTLLSRASSAPVWSVTLQMASTAPPTLIVPQRRKRSFGFTCWTLKLMWTVKMSRIAETLRRLLQHKLTLRRPQMLFSLETTQEAF